MALVDTSVPGSRGSMPAYARMVEKALAAAGAPVRTIRVALAPPPRLLDRCPPRCHTWLRHAWIAAVAARRLAAVRADFFHLLDGSFGYLARWLPPERSVVTAHDVIPLLQLRGRFSGLPPPARPAAWLIRQSVGGLHRAARVVAVSHNTRKDLVDQAGIPPERVEVVHSAIPQASLPPAPADTAARSEPGGTAAPPYILHVGNNGFYKNRIQVLRVFAILHRRMPAVRLKMAGPPPDRAMQRIVEEARLDASVDFVDTPDDAALAALYRNARLFVFPSIYEGFGWPPLEAMVHGCPVVCSNAASLPEVAGDGALTCAAGDTGTMAQLCLKLLEDPSLAPDLVRRGRDQVKRFSLEKMGEGVLRVYREVLGRTA